jgi:signal transduction histidine kinase
MATALAACLIMVAGIAVGVAVSAEGLPLGIDPSLSPRTARIVTGQPALLSLQLVAMGLYAAAAIGFVRRADEREDELFRWFAAGAGLAAFAHLNYFLFPSLYSEWVHTGDFLRLAFYLVLLAGAAREIGGYWQAAAAAAILEERRRMARDLHDGLAQELAFIRVQARRLADNRRADEVVEQISVAAERALDESRRAIAALTRPLDEPFGSTLTQVAEDIAVRMGLRLEFDVDDEVDAPPETREALLRVVREAVTNAGRHAQAGRVRIELRNGHGLRLRIRDDGAGFDPARPQGSTASGGFGLTSMQERVRALGGELRIASEPGAGTAIEVHVP